MLGLEVRVRVDLATAHPAFGRFASIIYHLNLRFLLFVHSYAGKLSYRPATYEAKGWG